MQGSFEKEVQRKMESLNLVPSAPVWEKIEVEIRAEKKRRRGAFWFLIAGLMIAGGGGWLAYQSLPNHGQQASVATSKAPQEKIIVDTASTSTKNYSNPTDTSFITQPLHATINKQKNRFENNRTVKGSHLPKKQEPELTEKAIVIFSRRTESPEQFVISLLSGKEKMQNDQTNNKQAVIKKEIEEKQTLMSIENNQTLIKHHSDSSVKDSSAKPQIKTDGALPVTIDSALKKKIAVKNKGWKKQVNFSAGWADYFGEDDLKYSASNFFQSPSTGSSSFSGPFEPQKTTAGPGFSIGVSVSKSLGKKWELALGLQYALYTTHIKVGDKKPNDTTVTYARDRVQVNNFFTNTAKENYTNRFHVLELPVTVSYQPVIKLPIYFSLSAAYGRLLSTNALTYNNSSNLYYQNKDNYLRNSLPVSTSIQLALRSKKAVSIRIGPFVQYNLLKLRKENISGKPHLAFAGIKTGINF